MSIKIMSTVWEKSKQKGSALLLLLAIADHAAGDGYCWPGIKHLAQKIRMSERSVMRLIKTIEDDGELFVIRSNINNRYVVMVDSNVETLYNTLTARRIPIPEIRGDKLSPDKMTGDTGDGPGDTHVTSEVTQLCHSNHHEPSVKHQEAGFPKMTEEETWPSDSNFAPVDDPVEDEIKKTVAKEKRDYITDLAAYQKRTGSAPSWTVTGPEGADPWANGPVKAFCKLAHMPNAPPGSVGAWARAFEKIAIPWEVGPPEVTEAIRLLEKDEQHNWRSFTSPLVPSFKPVLDVMISRVKSGETATSKEWSQSF